MISTRMDQMYHIPDLPLPYDLETKAVLKQLAKSYRCLSELKGVAKTIPNERILISTLILQEARDSSSVEDIVTTQDDIYRAGLVGEDRLPAAVKEVCNYREALNCGYTLVKANGLLTNNYIIQIQNTLKQTAGGFRSLPGTELRRVDATVVYRPPQDYDTVVGKMANLEAFINDKTLSDLDPLVKMAVIHHQFESIHPFTDGNGRTGRILNVLYLVLSGLLDLPILYLSRYVTRNKGEYYRCLQAVRDRDGDNAAEWEQWILYILRGVEQTSQETIALVQGIASLMADYKQRLKPLFGTKYRHEILNNLFFHPYTKIEFMQKELQSSRMTATKYLDTIVDAGLLEKRKMGRENYYVNMRLMALFVNREWASGSSVDKQ